MPDPILPNIIQGPAAIIHDGYTFYTKGPIIERLVQDSFVVESDMHGPIDERKRSQITEISFQPVGEIEQMSKYFPWDHTMVGKSIFTAANKTVVIHTRFGGGTDTGQTITYPRGGVSRMPPLRLKPTDTLFGEMTITCIGDKATQQTGTNFWRTIADAAFTDTGFDETKIATDRYQAAYGGSPYNAMGSLNGFELELALATKQIAADDVGIADIVVSGITAMARFIPDNLTQAQVDTLLKAQGTGAIFPGQSFAKGNTDLVIQGSGAEGVTLTATIYKAGPKAYEGAYGVGEHRHRVIQWMAKRTWTTGAGNPLWLLAVA